MPKVLALVVALLLLSTDVEGQWWRWGRPKIRVDEVPSELSQLKLLEEDDFTIDGGFCPPDTSSNGKYIDFSPSHGIAYRQPTNTMYITGHNNSGQGIAEMAIPALVNSSNPNSMNKATYTATGGIVEPSEGAYVAAYPTDPTAASLSGPTGMAVLHSLNKLLFSTEYLYDSGAQTKTHALRSLSLSTTGTVQGFDTFTGVNEAVGVGITRMLTMFASEVTSEWQAALGNCTVIVGAGASYSIITSGQSYGPDAFCIDPTVIGTGSAHNARPFVMYPQSHKTLGNWEDNPPLTPYFNFSTAYRSGALIGGTRTFLFGGFAGSDNFCYGIAKADPNDPTIGTRYPDPVKGPYTICYDPTSPDSGNHGYPYLPIIVAYDLLDFKAVVDGTKEPWEVLPYAHWYPTFPVAYDLNNGPRIGGMSWDATNNKLWIAQHGNYGAGCSGNNAVIWRMSVNRTP